MKYISYCELQDYINRSYRSTGNPISFSAAVQALLAEGATHEGQVPIVDFLDSDLNDTDAICQKINQMAIPVSEETIQPETDHSLREQLIVFKYPEHSRAGIHLQDGLELNYVCSGSCTMFFEGTEYLLKKDDVVIIPPNTHHDIYDTEGSVVFSFLIHQDIFNETFFQVIRTDTVLASFYSRILYQNAKTFLSFHLGESRRFLRVFLAMYAEAASLSQYRYEICINYIRILFSYLLRLPAPVSRNDALTEVENLLADMPVILRYIQNHYQSLSLGQLAEVFHYNRSYLGKQIKKCTGASFTELIMDCRLQLARSLLVNSKRSIEEIAELSGYQSADHFSRTFKKAYGCAPSVYRKQHLPEDTGR